MSFQRGFLRMFFNSILSPRANTGAPTSPTSITANSELASEQRGNRGGEWKGEAGGGEEAGFHVGFGSRCGFVIR